MCGVSNARGIAFVPGPLKGDENVFGRSNVPPNLTKLVFAFSLKLKVPSSSSLPLVDSELRWVATCLLCVDREGGQDYIMCR
jgi:hypothetical protein